jgi:hypothetical protein
MAEKSKPEDRRTAGTPTLLKDVENDLRDLKMKKRRQK